MRALISRRSPGLLARSAPMFVFAVALLGAPAPAAQLEFPAGLEWLNTEDPLTMRGLRGKIVLVDFWTYCCINCIHVIPDLKRLEKEFPNELVVIGVHSGKFKAEGKTDNIRQAILRYRIEHPVVNDAEYKIWNGWGVRSWPTLALFEPTGKLHYAKAGEGAYETFEPKIKALIRKYRDVLDRKPRHFRLERHKGGEKGLAFPGKVLADAARDRLFVADSGHNRIIVATLDGTVLDVAGSGKEGLKDGTFKKAHFRQPQGMTFDGKTLYVADTENHAIRALDLAARTVKTVAGNGEQYRRGSPAKGGVIRLASPWDLLLHKKRIYIAMAGPHQIWIMDPATGRVGPYAGSGREDILDGPLREARLAQPSGLTTDGTFLYFADSETSAIRVCDFKLAGKVETIVGKGLFKFGDKDGYGDEVRLQHPLGVVAVGKKIYVADTYNNKIKRLGPWSRQCETVFGSGEPGANDGEGKKAAFDEPGGISHANGKLYIADTNNNAVRVADIASGQVSTLKLKGLEKFKPAKP
jgi:thiol-disulfide isomerase/thioredoxin